MGKIDGTDAFLDRNLLISTTCGVAPAPKFCRVCKSHLAWLKSQEDFPTQHQLDAGQHDNYRGCQRPGKSIADAEIHLQVTSYHMDILHDLLLRDQRRMLQEELQLVSKNAYMSVYLTAMHLTFARA
jgi:hypothetical protein